jgi:hypothetical protein
MKFGTKLGEMSHPPQSLLKRAPLSVIEPRPELRWEVWGEWLHSTQS